jgi:hypothetical protein
MDFCEHGYGVFGFIKVSNFCYQNNEHLTRSTIYIPNQ